MNATITVGIVTVLLAITGCGGEIMSESPVAPSVAVAADAGVDCGIHETIEWPTYIASDAPIVWLPVGDAGLVEVCTRGDAGPFYLCAPPASE